METPEKQTNPEKIVQFRTNQENPPSLTLRMIRPNGRILYLEPRPVRHQERISDLFRVLFKKDK